MQANDNRKENNMIITAQQNETIVNELLAYAARNSLDITSGEIKVSVYPADYCPGQAAFTFSHPGHKANGSDWSMSSSIVNPDGSHFDSDPVKPWELA